MRLANLFRRDPKPSAKVRARKIIDHASAKRTYKVLSEFVGKDILISIGEGDDARHRGILAKVEKGRIQLNHPTIRGIRYKTPLTLETAFVCAAWFIAHSDEEYANYGKDTGERVLTEADFASPEEYEEYVWEKLKEKGVAKEGGDTDEEQQDRDQTEEGTTGD